MKTCQKCFNIYEYDEGELFGSEFICYECQEKVLQPILADTGEKINLLSTPMNKKYLWRFNGIS
jgi:hypothetical protein